MYECIMGLRDPTNLGAVLADEMGLGWGSPRVISCLVSFLSILEAKLVSCAPRTSLNCRKTLQVITLLWTMLKQGPQVRLCSRHGYRYAMHQPSRGLVQGKPSAKKTIAVTPSSLTKNWAAEVRKWLGDERLKVLVLQGGAEAKQQAMLLPCPQSWFETSGQANRGVWY